MHLLANIAFMAIGLFSIAATATLLFERWPEIKRALKRRG